MTVCIATICQGGRYIVCATDGMLTDPSSGLSGDVGAVKMMVYGDWLFMFAGTLSNADLIMEELRLEAFTRTDLLDREKIQSSVRQAYKKRFAKWSADRLLSPYDMEMGEFKSEGLSIFGDERFGELSRAIEQDAALFNEQMLVVGFGKSELAAMIYEVCRDGVASHSLEGNTCIGSGSQAASSTLYSLKCGRRSSLGDALYATLAAKFSAESSPGVGTDTVAVVMKKPLNSQDRGAFKIIQSEEIEGMRLLWRRHGKPKVPKQAYPELDKILIRIDAAGMDTMIRKINEANATFSNEPELPPEQSGGAAPQSDS